MLSRTWIPNLWAVGIARGVLGSLVEHVALGGDTGATILRLVAGE